ncbi:MAG: dihydrofolate reductase family protein [Bacteroidales bacterium]
MNQKNLVFIATSIDGYIADRNGGVEWLQKFSGAGDDDMGYARFISETDAILMGRKTFETVLGFGIDWPYQKPVFVLSRTLESVSKELSDRVFPVNGTLPEVLDRIHGKGYGRLYIDGGKTISSFLREDLIDEMIITIIPVLLGGGYRLFSELPEMLEFEVVETKSYQNRAIQCRYRRKGR